MCVRLYLSLIEHFSKICNYVFKNLYITTLISLEYRYINFLNGKFFDAKEKSQNNSRSGSIIKLKDFSTQKFLSVDGILNIHGRNFNQL